MKQIKKKIYKIIDNRNGKDDLEINEDGTGKWYIEHLPTGCLTPTYTKKESQIIIKHYPNFIQTG